MSKNSLISNSPVEHDIDSITYKRRWRILATLCTSLLLVATGNSSLNLGLPTIARELSLTSTQLTWMVDIYSLIFASLLFPMSSIADRYGRKTMLQAGLLVFTIATLYAAFLAHNGLGIIIARAVMGIGGAMVMPTTLSIINVVFPRTERARAIAIWSGVTGGGIALGSILTGFLLEHYSWQSIFIFSAVIGIIGFIFNQWLTPASVDEKQTPVDWLGGLLSTIGLMGLVYSIIESPSHGVMSPTILMSLTVGILGILSFIFWQLKTKHPMLEVRLFSHAPFGVSALSLTLAFFALMGVFFSMSQMFQLILGYGTLESSLKMLPVMFLMVFISPFVPNLVKIFGTRGIVGTGLALVSISFVCMSYWNASMGYGTVLGTMAIMMAGMALTTTPSTNLLMSSIPRNRSGMGSAMNDTTRELGGTLGVAVLGSVLSATYTQDIVKSIASLPDQIKTLFENSLAGAVAAGKTLGPTGVSFIQAAKDSWMKGLSHATLYAAAITFIAAIIAFIFLPRNHTEDIDDEIINPLITE